MLKPVSRVALDQLMPLISPWRCAAPTLNSKTQGARALTTRAFNITVNHRRRILSTTKGYPGRWNDKTLVTFDDFMRGIQDGEKLAHVEFDLCEPSGNQVRLRRYKGAWVMVDNGYLQWPTTIPPIKSPSTFDQLRWSKWLESLRKDVECTFGILKGR